MTKDDLKQISELLADNNKIVGRELSETMDDKLEKAFAKNNKTLLKEIDEKLEKVVDEITSTVNSAFTELEEKINNKFAQVEENFTGIKQDLVFLRDETRGVKHDATLLKYFHIKDLKKAPDSLTVITKLEEEGL